VTTATIIGTLRITGRVHYDDDRQFEMYAPDGVALENDGHWEHWMAPGETYEIRHDGTGWRVTCQTWTDGHIRRLADERGMFVSALPMAESGDVDLDPGVGYAIHSRPDNTFDLVQHG
jgi:hypothetical protein